MCTCFLGWISCTVYADPAQLLTTAAEEPDDLDRDLSGLSELDDLDHDLSDLCEL